MTVGLLSALPAWASAASAPRWKENGAFLGAGEGRSFVGSTVSEGVLSFTGLKMTIPAGGCAMSGEIQGSAAGLPGRQKLAIRCSDVKVSGAESVCYVTDTGKPGELVFAQLSGSLVYLAQKSSTAVGELIGPASGTEWANLKIAGAECGIAGTFPITGQLLVKFGQPGGTETPEQSTTSPSPQLTSYYPSAESGSPLTVAPLKARAAALSFLFTAKLNLENHQKFGVFPG